MTVVDCPKCKPAKKPGQAMTMCAEHAAEAAEIKARWDADYALLRPRLEEEAQRRSAKGVGG